MTKKRILFLDSYTNNNGDSEASDEIGYGITASCALKKSLILLGYEIVDLEQLGFKSKSKLEWIHDSYNLLRTIPFENFQLIFVFHSFHQFPTEIRRILLDRGIRHVKIIGYTHGSHWDNSDFFRELFYPGMKFLDLANLICMDCIFVVSHYFRNHLLHAIHSFNPQIAKDIENRLFVTGLPINTEIIDKYRTSTKENAIQIVFNHSPTKGKNPEKFFKLIDPILQKENAQLLVTRRFNTHSPGEKELLQLCQKYGARITLGHTLGISNYYESLWKSHIQVSMASHESLGISTIEAMYTYNCCLVPNKQSYPEVMEGLNLYSSEGELSELLKYYITHDVERESNSQLMHNKSIRFAPVKVADSISLAIEKISQ